MTTPLRPRKGLPPVAPVAFTQTSGGQAAIAVSIVTAAILATACILWAFGRRKRKASKARNQDAEAAVYPSESSVPADDENAPDQRRHSNLSLQKYEDPPETAPVVKHTVDTPSPRMAGAPQVSRMMSPPIPLLSNMPPHHRTPRCLSPRPASPRPVHHADYMKAQIPLARQTTNQPRMLSLVTKVEEDNRAIEELKVTNRLRQFNLPGHVAASPEMAFSRLPSAKNGRMGPPVKVAVESPALSTAPAGLILLPPTSILGIPQAAAFPPPATPNSATPPPVTPHSVVPNISQHLIELRESIQKISTVASIHEAKPVTMPNEVKAQRVYCKSPSPRALSPVAVAH